jgi:RNA polymerase sigma-70 factor (ECF subfamily)
LYGRALGLSHCEAEDVLQETFLALMQVEQKPDEPVNYCLRSYRNRVLNYRRSLWRRLTREWESLAWFESTGSDEPAEQEAVRCLASLPPEQREVIVLKIWHEFTYEGIGEMLGISPNTAAGRYRYGMNKLRTILKGHEYERDRSLGKAVAILDSAPPLV